MHYAAKIPCDVWKEPLIATMSLEKWEYIRSKRRLSTASGEEGKWRDIYRILFPGTEIPSPYYEPPLERPQSQSRQSSGSSQLELFQDFARESLPLIVEREFESIIQQRFQRPEDEIRSGFKVKDTIRKSFSELLKTWEQQQAGYSVTGSQSSAQQSHQSQLVYALTTTEGPMNNSGQPEQDLPNPAISGPSLATGNYIPEPNSSSTPETLSIAYPCICSNWQFGQFSPLPAEESLISDPSQSAGSSRGSLAMSDTLNNVSASGQDLVEPIITADNKGKERAQTDDPEAVIPPETCRVCFGLL